MNGQDLNMAMGGLLIGGLLILAAVWLWPEALDQVALCCRARAAALRAGRDASQAAYKKVMRAATLARTAASAVED